MTHTQGWSMLANFWHRLRCWTSVGVRYLYCSRSWHIPECLNSRQSISHVFHQSCQRIGYHDVIVTTHSHQPIPLTNQIKLSDVVTSSYDASCTMELTSRKNSLLLIGWFVLKGLLKAMQAKFLYILSRVACLAKQKMRHRTTHQTSVHRTDTFNNTELFIADSQDDVLVELEILPQNSLHRGKL